MDLNIKINGDLLIPDGYNGILNFLTPREVIENIIQYYGLSTPKISVIDPFAGFGTIPSLINQAGGRATGLEVSEDRIRFQFPNSNIQLADSFKYDFNGDQFEVIFTSIPFVGLLDNKFMTNVFELFTKILKPGGKILIDTVPLIVRDGQEFSSTKYSKALFEKNGFTEVTRHTFTASSHSDLSNQTIVLEFRKQIEI